MSSELFAALRATLTITFIGAVLSLGVALLIHFLYWSVSRLSKK